MPPLTNLRTDNFSHRADEKSSNGFPQRLTGGFRGVSRGVTAFMMGTALSLGATQAFAQNNDSGATVQMASTSQTAKNVSLTSSTNILPDAHRPANVWATQNPDGIAISLRLGTSGNIPVETMQDVFRSDFQTQGVQNVAFFVEQGNSQGTGVAFHTDDYVYGPYNLVSARKAVPTTVSQMKFNSEIGLNR